MKPYPHLILGAGKEKGLDARALCELGENAVKYKFPVFDVIVEFEDGPYIKLNEPKKFTLRIMENGLGIHQQYFTNIKFYTDDGVTLTGGNFYSEPLQNLYGYEIKKGFEVCAEYFTSPFCSIIADISLAGRHTSYQVKISFIAG